MLSDERLIAFCRGLSGAVKAGLPLSSAFETLARSRHHGRHVGRAAALIAGGAPMHEALSAQGCFPPVLLALLRAGEESGKITDFLDLYADCLDVRLEFGRRIRRALVYPAAAVIAAIVLFAVFLFAALPAVTAPLREAGVGAAELPSWAQAAMDLLKARWPVLLAGAAAALLLLRSVLRSSPARKALALAGHWLPGFRYTLEQGRLSNTYTTIGLLLKAGLPLGSMMEVMKQFAADDPVDLWRFRRAEEVFSSGRSFSEGIAPLMPEEDRQGLEMAEKAGWLDDTMLRLGKAAQARHLHRLKIVSNVFKIAVIASLAPLCFLMLALMLRAVFSALTAANGKAAEEPAALPSPVLPKEAAVAPEESSADFNRREGARIAGLMRAQGAPVQPASKSSSLPKLKPVTGIRRMSVGGSGGVQPTGIQPTDVSR